MAARTRPQRLPTPELTTVTTAIRTFNQRLAVRITAAVSTMACAYVFLFLAVLGFPGWHATAQVYVQWVSQTVIQLVMLSVIMVGQKIMADQASNHHAQVRALHDAHAADITALHAKVDALHHHVSDEMDAHAVLSARILAQQPPASAPKPRPSRKKATTQEETP